MAFSTEQIEAVRAESFPMGRLRSGKVVATSGLVLVRWRSGLSDRLFQVYVNGCLAGVTSEPDQRMLLIHIEPRNLAAIEVGAVDAEERWSDHSPELTGFSNQDSSRVELRVPRRGELPLNSVVKVYWDFGSGTIDYSEELGERVVWLEEAEKWGWGLDGFGKGDFGYSGTGAVGWGKGSFGDGEFGFDGDVLTYRSQAIDPGKYKFDLRLMDGLGNLDAGGSGVVEVFVDPIQPSGELEIESYDDSSNSLMLKIV